MSLIHYGVNSEVLVVGWIIPRREHSANRGVAAPRLRQGRFRRAVHGTTSKPLWRSSCLLERTRLPSTNASRVVERRASGTVAVHTMEHGG